MEVLFPPSNLLPLLFLPPTQTKNVNYIVYTFYKYISVAVRNVESILLVRRRQFSKAMAQLNIIFENLSKFYFEGEKVKVKLEVNLDKSSTVNNIMANFVGLSAVVPDDKSNDTQKKFTKNTTEIYFDDVFPLFVANNKEAASWSPGIQVFGFDFQLPHSLPSSVESPLIFVRYAVHVIAELNGEIQKKTEYFTVISKTDLNKDVTARLPGVLWKPENQCFLQELLCKTGPVRAFFHIAKRGYVPGESLLINAEICNFHRFPIEWVKIVLMQILKANGKGVEQRRIVTEMTRGCILPTETQTWRSESITIPAVPPTTYGPKKLITIKYRILFQYKPSWQRKPLELKQKITIGAVGVVECGQGEEQGQGEAEKVYNSEYFNGSNLEPCIFGPHSIEEDGKVSTFSPLYPMYLVM